MLTLDLRLYILVLKFIRPKTLTKRRGTSRQLEAAKERRGITPRWPTTILEGPISPVKITFSAITLGLIHQIVDQLRLDQKLLLTIPSYRIRPIRTAIVHVVVVVDLDHGDVDREACG